MSNSIREVKKDFDINIWLILHLAKEDSVPLTTLAEEYSKQRGIKLQSARKVLERHLNLFVENGIVERLDTYPISFKLKKLPIEYLFTSKNLRLNHGFDLSQCNHKCKTLGNSANPKQKFQELRKKGLRVITRANKQRQRALLTAQRPSILPGTREHADIAFLYKENVKEWNRSVLAFENENEEFLLTKVRTRFTDRKKALMNLIKSNIALKNAFRKHENAIMITLTIPHVFQLVLPYKADQKIIGFIPLQDSIITQLKANMLAWIRKNWNDRKIEVFTAYEYHSDYTLHLHVLVFGIPYLIDWTRKYGRKKEDALSYFSRKYDIPLPSKAKKTQIAKYIFTALLDKWLQKILVRFDGVLKTDLLNSYLYYKKKDKLQGPVNEIHAIKNGKWKGKPPRDALIEYSSGAAYQKVISPDKYVTKYVTKMLEIISTGGGNINEENEGKVFGYWLFGKRFNSFSRALIPKTRKDTRRINNWYYVGVFNKLNLPDFIAKNVVIEI